MPKANHALDVWHPEAIAAFDEYKKRCEPAWKRALAKLDAQHYFEEQAIEKEARRLYHERLLGPAL